MHSRPPAAVYVSETHHPSPTYSKHLQLNAPCSTLVPKHHVAQTFTCTCNCCNAAHIAEKISASTMYQQFLFSAIYLRHSPPLHKLFIFASLYSIETFGRNLGPGRGRACVASALNAISDSHDALTAASYVSCILRRSNRFVRS